jgi:hypothetical protein
MFNHTRRWASSGFSQRAYCDTVRISITQFCVHHPQHGKPQPWHQEIPQDQAPVHRQPGGPQAEYLTMINIEKNWSKPIQHCGYFLQQFRAIFLYPVLVRET